MVSTKKGGDTMMNVHQTLADKLSIPRKQAKCINFIELYSNEKGGKYIMDHNQEKLDEIQSFLKKVKAVPVDNGSTVWYSYKGMFELVKGSTVWTEVFFHYRREITGHTDVRISLTKDPWQAASFNRMVYYADRDWPNIKFVVSIHTA